MFKNKHVSLNLKNLIDLNVYVLLAISDLFHFLFCYKWPFFVMCVTTCYLINCRDGVNVGLFYIFGGFLCVRICTEPFLYQGQAI